MNLVNARLVAAGGGGVPVVRDEPGGWRGVEAVIDKDFASALLASSIGADLFFISTEVEKVCRRLSCVYPDVCVNLNTDHSALVKLYRSARELPGVKKVLRAFRR